MKSSDPNASDPSDQHGRPVGFSRRQLLAGTPLAAFGVAVSGLNLGSVTSSPAAESTEKENFAEAPGDLSRRSEAKEEELDDFMFDIEKDGNCIGTRLPPNGLTFWKAVSAQPSSLRMVKLRRMNSR
jgi:hypothetical protein